MRYDGAKNYNGGNVNYFNGAIKADGNFSFAGDGNRAKVEVIAIDLDGTFSMHRAEKNVPPLYVEQFDFVSPTYDEHKISAQIELDSNFEPEDNNGDLIIRRRLRYNGISRYRGNFEYAERRYNGNLNYGGVYRLNWDGSERFNGKECYGGRKNVRYIEYISSLDGNEKFIDDSSFEKIPIATHTDLGFVIVGNNIDLDDNGKISMPRRFNMKAMDADTLYNIFQTR